MPLRRNAKTSKTLTSIGRWLDRTKACYTYKHLSKASLDYLRLQDFQVIHLLHSNCIRN